MDRTGTNLPAVGEHNQTVVLDAIRRRPEGITRSEIAALTALSQMTVTNACRRLLDAGLVDEHGRRAGRPGKPAAVVKLNPGGGFAVGVHIDPASVTYVLVDLAGTVRDHSRTGTPTARDADAVIAEMAGAVEGTSRDFAFMYYGTGLSMAGEVVRGVSSNAGDAGHMTVEPGGEICTCGRRGCVGYITVPRTLVERAGDGTDLDDVVAVEAAFGRLAALAAAGRCLSSTSRPTTGCAGTCRCRRR